MEGQSAEKFLTVSSLRDKKKSSEDLAQHPAASSGRQMTFYSLKKLYQDGFCGMEAATKPLFQKGNRVPGKTLKVMERPPESRPEYNGSIMR